MHPCAQGAFDMARMVLIVHGIVQGVGYRWLVKRAADAHHICGFVRNMEDGSVMVVADGDAHSMRSFREAIYVDLPQGPQVMAIGEDAAAAKRLSREKYDGFYIACD